MKPLMIGFSAVLVTAFVVAASGRISAGDKYQDSINCDLHAGSCTQTLGEAEVTLEVTPQPIKAMQDLSFKVTLTGKLPKALKAPSIDLGMLGMKMGQNRVTLLPAGNNTFEGKGVIVKCPSGRRIWRASVMIPGMGQTDFIFDVVY